MSEEQLAIEFWEHEVMAQVRDFISLEGADTFKDALMTFDRDTYDKLFHPEKRSEQECYLTSKRT